MAPLGLRTCMPVDSRPGSTKVVALHVSAQECGIHAVPLITLEAIWSKATALLQGGNTISPCPGADTGAETWGGGLRVGHGLKSGDH